MPRSGRPYVTFSKVARRRSPNGLGASVSDCSANAGFKTSQLVDGAVALQAKGVVLTFVIVSDLIVPDLLVFTNATMCTKAPFSFH